VKEPSGEQEEGKRRASGGLEEGRRREASQQRREAK
jgi:hypothetical protein